MDDLKDTACGGDLLPQAEGDEMEMSYVKLFFDWQTITKKLSAEEKGRLIDAIVLYADTGDEQAAESALIGNEAFVFPHYQAQIDRDKEALDKLTQTRSDAGKLGGRPKKQKNQMVFDESKKSYEKEKEEEKEKEKEEDKKEKYKRKNVVDFADIKQADCYFPESPRLEQGLREWLAYKAERRETYKERGLTSLVTRIRNKVSEIGEDAVLESIADCMANNYQGLFFKEKRHASGGGWNFSDFRRDNYHS